MTTSKNKTSKGQHGGARPGAGRKPKDRTPQGCFESAEDYLQAVVTGTTPPDAVRVSAARALIQYQLPKKRTKPKSPPPRKLAEQEEANIENESQAEFEKKAAKIREKYARRKQND